MIAQNWLAFFNVLSFVGALTIVMSGIGIWYFGNKVDNEKATKVSELIKGKNELLELSNAYLADLRNKDAEIAHLKSSVSDMEPVLSLLDVQFDKSKPNEKTLVLGASYPVDLRQVNINIEFTSSVEQAERSVAGSGLVQCNFRKPIIKGNTVKLSGGPLNASNYLLLKIRTKERFEIKSHNLRIQK